MKPSDPSPLGRRKSSNNHYQTFGINPPKSRGQPPSDSSNSTNGDHTNSNHDEHRVSPLPLRQLGVLAFMSLCEQTALNSMSPYLPSMVSQFPEVDASQTGVYVGTIASAFALAQLSSNYFWGWLSDRIGRKPVILTGTILSAACIVAFGFTRTLWQAIVIQALLGLVNGNQGIVSTCLGELTDRSNQSKAFAWLPVIYGIGAITGPVLGGVLVLYQDPFDKTKPNPYPYLLPNLISAAILVIDFIVASFLLKESLEEVEYMPPLSRRFKNLFAWMWQFRGSSRPSYTRRSTAERQRRRSSAGEDVNSDATGPSHGLLGGGTERLRKSNVLNRDTVLIMATYLILELSNVAYTSLYPVWAADRPPTGRNLSTSELGLTLGFAGIVVIIFQIGIFTPLKNKIGNRWMYRLFQGLFVLAFILTPWVGYKEPPNYGSISVGKIPLWIELGAMLMIKTIAAVGGMTVALLLVTNTAPNHAVLGALNGLAQTLSAAGRAIGPFVAGSIYTASTHVHPKGEALAFGVFGIIAFIGFLLSFGIRSPDLEAEGWEAIEDDGSDKSEDEEEH